MVESGAPSTTSNFPSPGIVTHGRMYKSFPLIFNDGTFYYNPMKHSFLAEPTCYKLALSDPYSCTPMESEFVALQKNKTWSLVLRPLGNVVG